MDTLRQRAWWVLVLFAFVLVLFGLTDIAGGVAADPGITLGLSGMTLAEVEAAGPTAFRLYDFTTRTQGLALLVMGGLLAAILLIPYRRGERWAWYAAWSVPAWAMAVLAMYLVAGTAADQPPPPPMVSAPITAAIGTVVLLLDRRRFRQDRATLDPAPDAAMAGSAWTGG